MSAGDRNLFEPSATENDMYLYTLSPYSLSHRTARPAFCRVDLVNTRSHGMPRVLQVLVLVAEK